MTTFTGIDPFPEMLKGENLAGIDKYVHRPEAKDQDHKIDTTAEANDVWNGAVQGWGQSLGMGGLEPCFIIIFGPDRMQL